MAAPEWSAVWPTEPGWYWFHGWRSKISKKNFPAETRPIQVREGRDAPIYVIDGAFAYPGDGEGVFMPMTVPEPPSGDARPLGEGWTDQGNGTVKKVYPDGSYAVIIKGRCKIEWFTPKDKFDGVHWGSTIHEAMSLADKCWPPSNDKTQDS